MVADECNIQHEPNGVNRWSEVGKTPVIKVNRSRDAKHRISLFGALSITTGKVLSFFCHWLNSETTIEFLGRVKAHRSRLLQTRNITSLPILLLWDNARYHKSKEVKAWLVENPGVVELMNFPPYCPERNPQEHAWRAMKQHLASRKTYAMQFDDIVTEAKRFLKKTFRYRLL